MNSRVHGPCNVNIESILQGWRCERAHKDLQTPCCPPFCVEIFNVNIIHGILTITRDLEEVSGR